MRTRTHALIFRLGFTLAVLVLGVFLALIGAVVFACVAVIGGPAGWVAGLALGIAVAQATRRPCAALIGRLVDSV
jgi:hypothetical protein